MMKRIFLTFKPIKNRFSSNFSFSSFSHIDLEKKLPKMVDISSKIATKRVAIAQSRVFIPLSIYEELTNSKWSTDSVNTIDEIKSAKGSVFSTAIVAGVFAAKNTSNLIPFCHPIPIEKCTIRIKFSERLQSNPFLYQNNFDNIQTAKIKSKHENNEKWVCIKVECETVTTSKTGVEMESLVGASNASLCIYDMLKSAVTIEGDDQTPGQQRIMIGDTFLLEKSGGKSNLVNNHY